jgi:hypothetical protein
MLEQLVLDLIKAHIAVYMDTKERMRVLNGTAERAGKRLELNQLLSEKQARKQKVEDFVRILYEDYTEGLFSDGEYLEMKSGYLRELDCMDTEIAGILAELETFGADYGGGQEMECVFRRYLGVETLSYEMVQAFIRKIVCFGNDRFEVTYRFADELEAFRNLAGVMKGADAV